MLSRIIARMAVGPNASVFRKNTDGISCFRPFSRFNAEVCDLFTLKDIMKSSIPYMVDQSIDIFPLSDSPFIPLAPSFLTARPTAFHLPTRSDHAPSLFLCGITLGRYLVCPKKNSVKLCFDLFLSPIF